MLQRDWRHRQPGIIVHSWFHAGVRCFRAHVPVAGEKRVFYLEASSFEDIVLERRAVHLRVFPISDCAQVPLSRCVLRSHHFEGDRVEIGLITLSSPFFWSLAFLKVVDVLLVLLHPHRADLSDVGQSQSLRRCVTRIFCVVLEARHRPRGKRGLRAPLERWLNVRAC